MSGDYIRVMLLKIPAILFALTFHECAHGWVATRLGDPTPGMLGRVTLNPLRHLDFVGTIALFVTGMFGWAKPVPINPRNFRNPSRDMMMVALAGPAANLFLALASAVIYKFMLNASYAPGVASSFFVGPLFAMVKISIIVNVALAVFNLLPVPPLDGSRVLSHFLPAGKALGYSRLEPYGFLILVALITTGVVNTVVSPLVFYTVKLLVSGAV
ncbi:MAG: site-2 protease family protein [Deltaproteobacteria bacterium]|nr:site-2 protease family protein [Deltaproteobacteria bacterium]